MKVRWIASTACSLFLGLASISVAQSTTEGNLPELNQPTAAATDESKNTPNTTKSATQRPPGNTTPPRMPAQASPQPPNQTAAAAPGATEPKPVPARPLYGRYPLPGKNQFATPVAYTTTGTAQEPSIYDDVQPTIDNTTEPTPALDQSFKQTNSVDASATPQRSTTATTDGWRNQSETSSVPMMGVQSGGTGPLSNANFANPINGSVTGYGAASGNNYAVPSANSIIADQSCDGCDSDSRLRGRLFAGDDCDADSGRRSRFGQFFCKGNANTVIGVNALAFSRDYEDDLGLAYNSIGQYLFTTDADDDYFGGVEASISRRCCDGLGWELRYWGLFPSQSTVTFGYTPYTSLYGLQNLYYVPNAVNVQQIYNSAYEHRLYRNSEFHNLEWNFLRNGGSYCALGCRQAHFELFSGFRWFKFDESLRWSAFNSGAGYPAQFNYDAEVENSLLGFQLGGRTERCLSERLRWSIGLKGGLYNNHIRQHNCFADLSGNYATIWAGPYNGTWYDFQSTKNDLAILSELDLSLIYQIACNSRFNIGYRAMGVNGVALAADQIPYNFTDAWDIRRIDSNGSLILHGAYAGFQFCY